MRQTRKEFIGTVRMDLGSQTLQSAIDAGNAIYMIQVHCPRTSFRSSASSYTSEFQFEIAESTLRDDFTVQPFLVSSGNWELASAEFAATFEGLSFPIQKGYPLAVGPPVSFNAEKRLDDLRSVHAIFHVLKNPDAQQQLVEFDFERDRIAIFLSQDDYDHYKLFRARQPYSHLFVCSLVLPALQQALVLMKESETSNSTGPRWQRVIRRCLKDIQEGEFDKDRTFEVAQKLLEFPLSRAFAAVNTVESEAE
jgi:hypothetical protein